MQVLESRPGRYLVQSESHPGLFYHVKESTNWTCDCPDNIYRSYRECKHILAAKKRYGKIRALVYRP